MRVDADWSLDERRYQHVVARAIGSRLKEERRRLGVTLDESAEAAGISAAMLSRIENAKAVPSMRTLARLSRALTIPMPDFFTGLEEDREASLVKAGQGIVVSGPASSGRHEYQVLAPPSPRRKLVEPWLTTITDVTETFPFYQAIGTGLVYLLEGEMVFRCGHQAFEMALGDTVLYDLQVPHRPEPLVAPVRFLHVTLATPLASPTPMHPAATP